MRLLRKNPVFLILFPLFFVLHGFTENYDFVPPKDALLLLLLYLGSSLAIASLFWLFYRDFTKSSLVAFAIMAYHFFFGSMQDLLKKHFAEATITRYSVILPVSFIFLLAIIVWLKRNNNSTRSILLYLNYLLLLLISIDAAWLVFKIVPPAKPAIMAGNDFSKCDSCKKPDIFLIILDEYSGNTALKDRFGFDNSGFENELRNRGFHITDSSMSNYNYTPFSMASMLNMRYLNLDMKTKGPGNLNYCYGMIRDSRVKKILEANDYKFYNYSIFDFNGQPSVNSGNFLPARTELITSQTFVSRIWKDVLFNVSRGKWSIKPIEEKVVYAHLRNNNNFTHSTIETAKLKINSPKFVYTHLMMPHHPYYFDSSGKALPFDSLLEGKQYNKHNYTSYLQYCNKKILQLTDSIITASVFPPIIILTGDHGFRYFAEKENRRYYFINLSAVYLPEKNYTNFYAGMTAVNLFPIIFNTQFQQKITLQKDSTIYLWE